MKRNGSRKKGNFKEMGMKKHLGLKVAGSRVRWVGHPQRMWEERLTKRAWKTKEGGKRRRGRSELKRKTVSRNIYKSLTLVKDQCRLDIRKYSFSQRTTKLMEQIIYILCNCQRQFLVSRFFVYHLGLGLVKSRPWPC